MPPAVALAKDAAPLRLTHPDRVIDPSTGFTKGDLALYYAQAASWLLPHLKGRHTFIQRAPSGIGGRMFFQEHPEGVRVLKGTDPQLWPGHEPAIRFDAAADLVAAVQVGMIEIHPWNSTAADILHPDRLVFDLDPGEGVRWQQLQQAATLTRTMLDELGLRSWLKTTGGKSLHVVVPILPELGFDAAKDFSRRVVAHMARTLPQLFVAKSGPRNRPGRIFVDFLRNGQSQTTAAAFSARARPGMGVSMPVDWKELPDLERGDEWNIRTALQRLAALRTDPWKGFWRCRQSMAAAADKLP